MWIRCSLLQVMACHLFGTKPLHEPLSQTAIWTLRNIHISLKLYLRFKYFLSRKWKNSQNTLEIFVCKMTAILPMPQCGKGEFYWISQVTGIILYMHPANERWPYNVTSSLIGWAHSRIHKMIPASDQCQVKNMPSLNVSILWVVHTCGSYINGYLTDSWGMWV